MKRIIISNKMLQTISEATTTLQFATNNNDINTSLSKGDTQSQIQNAQSTFGGNITAQFTPSDGPGDSTISIPNVKGGTTGAAEAVKDNSPEVQKALSNGMNVGVDVSEGKKFSKKDIEEARLAKIRKEGKVMSKKEMNESLMRENNLEQEINSLPAFTVLDAYSILGDRQELATEWDMVGAIVKKFNESTPEKQQAFMNALHGNN